MQLKESQIVAGKVINDILLLAQRTAHFNHLINTKMSIYCYKQSLKYTETIYQQRYRQSEYRQDCIMEKQPNALIQDNFFPTAAEIDQPQKPKLPNKKNVDSKQRKDRIVRNNTQHSLSQVSLTKKLSKPAQPTQYQKLDLPQPQQQQAILKQLRKQVQEQSNKLAQNEAKNKEQKPKKKEGKQQKLGFDYDGQVIRLRSQNRNSLISGGLNGETLKTIQKLKQANKNVQHTQIDYQRKDKKLNKIARNNQVQFTDIKALLSQVRVTKGIKMIEQGRVIQQKKKTVPVKQLMKTLTSRKLSKDDYKRIKQTTGNVAPYDDYSNPSKTMNTVISQPKNQAQQNLSQFRSASQSKLSNSLTRRKSTITVGDAQLFQNLISAAQNQATYRSNNLNQQIQKQDKTYQKFDSNDYYNLQYMKKGGSMQIKKTKSTADLAVTKLPKIQVNKQQMPRIRQKLKDKQQIVRAIRRKFQQKLRT